MDSWKQITRCFHKNLKLRQSEKNFTTEFYFQLWLRSLFSVWLSVRLQWHRSGGEARCRSNSSSLHSLRRVSQSSPHHSFHNLRGSHRGKYQHLQAHVLDLMWKLLQVSAAFLLFPETIEIDPNSRRKRSIEPEQVEENSLLSFPSGFCDRSTSKICKLLQKVLFSIVSQNLI